MSVTQLTVEPSSLYAGDTISWLIAVPDYPATAGWTLKYKAVSNVTSGYFALVSTANGDQHQVDVVGASVVGPPAVTGTDSYVPGSYTLTRYVEHSDGSRVTLGELALTVKPNLAGKSAAFDNRSHVKKVLDAIEAVMEGRAASDQLELTIDGTTLKRMPVAELLKFRSQYLTYYQQELAAASVSSSAGVGKIRVRV
jgi:hypothetical protein